MEAVGQVCSLCWVLSARLGRAWLLLSWNQAEWVCLCPGGSRSAASPSRTMTWTWPVRDGES